MKQRLAALSQALATDMESHAVAEVAWEAGVPFIALRVILDVASEGLPAIVKGSVDRHGRPRKSLVAARLALAPWNYKVLRRLETESREAHEALSALAPLAPVLFGGPP
jgi:adenosylhomocysteine nucleosidase